MNGLLSFDVWVFVGLILSATLALVGPGVAAVLFHRATQAPWRALGIGVATFVVSQCVLRLPWQLAIGVIMRARFAADPLLAHGWIVLSALTAGLFEETGRYVAFRRFLKTERSFRVGVMFGIGHGGIESILLVGISLAGSAVVYLLITHDFALPLNATQHEAVVTQFRGVTFPLTLMGGLERVSAMLMHIGMSLAVMRAVTRSQPRWYVAAVAFHTLSGIAGVEATKAFGAYVAEATIAAFGLAALAFILHARKAE